MKLRIIIIVIFIILIINFSPFSSIFRENYTYSNYDGSFKFEEQGSGYDFNMALRRYQKFLKNNQAKKEIDSQLYRTFTIKPWRFWEWGEYIFHHERFALPYKPR
jgi:hypothetical protein